MSHELKAVHTVPLHTARSEKAQSLVEFALILPVLIMVMVAAIDIGRAYFAFVAITNASREGARYAAGDPTDTSGIKARVEKEVENSNLTITDSMIATPACYVYVNGSTAYGASETCVAASSGDYVQVTVNYPFYFLTGYVLRLGSVTMTQSTTMSITK